MDNAANLFWERITPNHSQVSIVRRVLYSGKTPYQAVEIIETASFGLTLVLDGKTQSAELDEHIYHEALVHPAMVLHPNPQKVFIAGGGEGATLREALSHKTVQQAFMVDIDSHVVELCKRYLPAFSAGAFEDPRAQLLIQDARGYLTDTTERFDVIIIDIPDPLEGGPAYLLYTQNFYRLLAERLNPHGIIVAQAGPTAISDTDCFTAVHRTISSVFPKVFGYQTYIASFGSPWGFTIAGPDVDPMSITGEEIERRLSVRLGRPLRFYDGTTHRGLFALPKYLREAVAKETRVITEENPLLVI